VHDGDDGSDSQGALRRDGYGRGQQTTPGFRGAASSPARRTGLFGPAQSKRSPTLFEIHRYQLTDDEFGRALARLDQYRTGVDQTLVYAMLTTLVRLRMTWPLGWVTRHYDSMRVLLGLR